MRYNLNNFRKFKQQKQRFACLTAYDASFARAMERAGVHCLLVGDSLGMVIKGQESTLSVSMQEMIYHTRCVHDATEKVFIMADMPFGSCGNNETTYDNACQLMAAGAHIVKIEAHSALVPQIQYLSERGIPVCCHLGLLPQSVHKLGGYLVQGKDEQSFQQILSDAKAMETAGAQMLLLECVPAQLAKTIRAQCDIPVIGIGAGRDCDAQVLVCYDMLGLSPESPSFSYNFLQQADSIQSAFEHYVRAVVDGEFPGL